MEKVLSLLQLIWDVVSRIFSKTTRNKATLKSSLSEYENRIKDIIFDYNYAGWNVSIRNKKLEVLNDIEQCIKYYGSNSIKQKLDDSLNIREAIKNIDKAENVDDIIKIKSVISIFLKML